MPTITLSIPKELKKNMDKFTYVNWSAVARESITDKTKELEMLQSIVKKSKLTQKDADEIGRKISEGMSARYMKLIEKSK